MGHKQDFWERLRMMFARPIGALVTGRKCSMEDPDRCVGYVDMDEEQFEEVLHDMHYHRNPLSYWKSAPGLGCEQGSWRKTDGDWQIHVVLYSKESESNRTYIYAHWEKRWDVDPIGHLRLKGFNVTKGVNEMRRDLNMHGVEVEYAREMR